MANSIILDRTAEGRIEATLELQHLVIEFFGAINEDLRVPIVITAVTETFANAKSVEFNMSKVDRVNSNGVRQWIQLMQRLPKTVNFTFSNLSVAFVNLANITPGILANRSDKVISFYVPYRCSTCKVDTEEVLRPQDIKFDDGQPVVPQKSCGKCKLPLSFDDIENEYFQFLKGKR